MHYAMDRRLKCPPQAGLAARRASEILQPLRLEPHDLVAARLDLPTRSSAPPGPSGGCPFHSAISVRLWAFIASALNSSQRLCRCQTSYPRRCSQGGSSSLSDRIRGFSLSNSRSYRSTQFAPPGSTERGAEGLLGKRQKHLRLDIQLGTHLMEQDIAAAPAAGHTNHGAGLVLALLGNRLRDEPARFLFGRRGPRKPRASGVSRGRSCGR